MFKFLKMENAQSVAPEVEVLEATTGEAIAEGEALVIASGKFTKCGATVKPTHIAAGSVTSGATDRKLFAVRVTPAILFKVGTSASAASSVIGTKVTIHTDGLLVTATTTSGVATIMDLNGASAQGDEIIVRFE